MILATVLSKRKPPEWEMLEFAEREAASNGLMLYASVEDDTEWAAALENRGWATDSWTRLGWLPHPMFDQDQAGRLARIVTGRNMAMDFAVMHESAVWFVDSDVVPPDGAYKMLMETAGATGAPIVGGLVPGRGAHAHVDYLFGGKWDKGLWRGIHGTLGCAIVPNSLRFRYGFSQGRFTPEDMCIADDAHAKFCSKDSQPWVVDGRVRCKHLGPLVLDEAVNDYEVPREFIR